MIFQAPALLHVGAPTRDGGMRLRFETNELSDADKLILLGFDNKFGMVLFKENIEIPFDPKQLPKTNAENKKLSKSQQLRFRIYRYWEKCGKPNSFETFYDKEVDIIINEYQNKLDE